MDAVVHVLSFIACIRIALVCFYRHWAGLTLSYLASVTSYQEKFYNLVHSANASHTEMKLSGLKIPGWPVVIIPSDRYNLGHPPGP